MRLEGLVFRCCVERTARGEEELRYDDDYQQSRKAGEHLPQRPLLQVGWLRHGGDRRVADPGASSGSRRQLARSLAWAGTPALRSST
jgi:hypothetical protein